MYTLRGKRVRASWRDTPEGVVVAVATDPDTGSFIALVLEPDGKLTQWKATDLVVINVIGP